MAVSARETQESPAEEQDNVPEQEGDGQARLQYHPSHATVVDTDLPRCHRTCQVEERRHTIFLSILFGISQ